MRGTVGGIRDEVGVIEPSMSCDVKSARSEALAPIE
jgi:hypothetical protein